MLFMRIFIPLVLACMSAAPSWSAYGDQLTVQDDSPLPPGWVVVGFAGGIQMGSAPANPKITIVDMNGAAFGTKATVLASSPIPSGWVNLGSPEGAGHWSIGAVDKKSAKVVIQCLVAPVVATK